MPAAAQLNLSILNCCLFRQSARDPKTEHSGPRTRSVFPRSMSCLGTASITGFREGDGFRDIKDEGMV
jgi:hypothetical protein